LSDPGAPLAHATPPRWFRIITNAGEILVETYPQRAAASVAAFAQEVARGAYSGSTFDRIVRADNDRGHPPIEVIQAFQRTSRTSRETIVHEPTGSTGLLHLDGTISLPRVDGGGSSARTFFICVGAQPALDQGGGRTDDGLGFAAFGRVVEGMETVRAIHRTPTAPDAGSGFMRGQIAIDPVVIDQIVAGTGMAPTGAGQARLGLPLQARERADG